ncbi:exodeoxyribonuclease VII large subunit [Candidatus Nitrospira bockiana]
MALSLQRILTVSELTFLVRERLEQTFPDVWVEGEVSNVRTPGSGHLYFTLKDHQAQIKAVLFRSSASCLRFTLDEGLHLIARGRLTVYQPRGEYQLAVDYLEPKGLGALQIAFEQLKEKLAKEGLFALERKRRLPLLPRRVGLVTSPTGAAIRDVLTVLQRRCPILSILVYPVPVQGDGAAQRIAAAIDELGGSGEVDVMIVGRGGGSLEDLWCFNEEVVVRAIAASPVPVVSAVGHEIDYTLADFVADYRAPTPSAAAEAVAPVLQDLLRTVQEFSARQYRALRQQLDRLERTVAGCCQTMSGAVFRVQRESQRLDDIAGRLEAAIADSIRRSERRRALAEHRVLVASPRGTIRTLKTLLPHTTTHLQQAWSRAVSFRRQRVQVLLAALHTLSPLAILARGYSIVQTVSDGKVLRRSKDVSVDEEISVRLTEGRLLCGVRRILPDP